MYLIRHSSPAIAVSYIYVNPVVALLLGRLVPDETVFQKTVLAMVVILTSIALVFRVNYRPYARPGASQIRSITMQYVPT